MDNNAGPSKRKNSGSLQGAPAKRRPVESNDDVINPPERPRSRQDFEVAIICALTLEADAVEGLEVFDDCMWYEDGVKGYGKAKGDLNTYSTGYIAGHNVVLAHMPGMGTVNAATVASNCHRSFPNIRLALVVGICGAVPFKIDFKIHEASIKQEVVLGDVIISHGVVQHDLGDQLPERFKTKDTLELALSRPPLELRGFLAKLKGHRTFQKLQRNTSKYLEILQTQHHLRAQYPGTDQDKLFEATYRHLDDDAPCAQAGCNGRLLPRDRLKQGPPTPAVHFGMIASGNTVMKSGAHRDNVVEKRNDIVAFEMEGAGVWDVFPCVVIKGACDYSDSHKPYSWQPYAAVAAAASLKTFLELWDASPKNEPSDTPMVELLPIRSQPSQVREEYNGSKLGVDIKTRLKELLYFTKIDERLTNLRAAQKDTCRWFFTTPKYIAWRNLLLQSGHSGFLWIKGNPGTGKSTIMKLLFEDARAKASRDPSQIILSFFFLARGTIEEKSTKGLYSALLHHLFEMAPDLDDSLEWMTPSGARGIIENGWNEEALKQTLGHAVSKLNNRCLTIFVDALDECDRGQAADMVGLFEGLCDEARESQTRLKICFSSRYYPDIRTDEENQVSLEKEPGHDEDIKKYIRTTLKIGTKKQNEQLRSEIFDKSSGIFLWVVLVLQLLTKKGDITIKAMLNRLEELPAKLDDLFQEIVTRDEESSEQLNICLKLILFAKRPLKPPELYVAVQLGLDENESGDWDQESLELDQLETFVRTSSKGLAEVTRNKAREVQFIHESVRDFLVGTYRKESSGISNNLEGHCHNLLRNICLAKIRSPIEGGVEDLELLQSEKDREARKELVLKINLRYPFLEYSINNVFYHADCAQQHSIDQASFLDKFPLGLWVSLNNNLENFSVRRYSKSVSLVYILAERDFPTLLRIHFQPASFFAVGDERFGVPLLAALATGSEKAAKGMLMHPDIRSQLPRGLSDELWTQCCLISVEDTRFSRQFAFSSRKGIFEHLNTAKDETLLLAHILSQEHMDKDKNDGAQIEHWWLASSQYRAILHMLNKAQSEVDAKDTTGATPLLWAARESYTILLQLLLEIGAEINTADNSGRTPLSWAATQHSNDKNIQLLCDAGAIVDSKDNSGRTPLSWAVETGYSNKVQLLLDAGAIVDSKDNSGRTPLSWATATIFPNDESIQLLLDAGAIVDSKDYSGRTPLSWAITGFSKEKIVQLLDAGAIVDSKDYSGRTPLSWAITTRYSTEETVQLLLDAGAIVDSKDNSGRTLLSWAATTENEYKLQFLLNAGAIVDSKDKSGRTPLSWAIESQMIANTRLLLDKGADPNSKDDLGLTPLLRAQAKGNVNLLGISSDIGVIGDS